MSELRMDTLIENLPILTRTKTALHAWRPDLKTLSDLRNLSDHDYLRIPECGKTGLRMIRQLQIGRASPPIDDGELSWWERAHA